MWRLYLTIRVREYLREAGAAAKRYWQWIVLIVGFFFLVIDFDALAAPLATMARTGASAAQGWGTLLSLHALGGVFAALQHRAMAGGPPAGYLRTLPIPAGLQWLATLGVLLLANSLFWLYLALPIVLHVPGNADVAEAAAIVLLVINAALLLLLLQAYWLHGRIWIVPVVILLDFTISAALAGREADAALGFQGLLALVLLAWLVYPVERLGQPAWRLPRVEWRVGAATGPLSPPRAVVVQHRLLIDTRPVQTASRAVAGGLVALTAWAIVALGDNRDLGPSLLVISGCFVALAQSGSLRVLDQAHRAAQPFLGTLPLAPMTLPLRDLLYVALLCAAVMLPLSAVFLWHGYARAGQVAVAWTAWIGLLALLQPVSTRAGRHSVTLTTVITLGWITAVLAL